MTDRPLTDRPGRSTPSPVPDGLPGALRTMTYEVLPFPHVEDAVRAHVPREIGLTISTTTARGLDPTVELAVRLRAEGYRVAPHVVARLLRDEAHLADVVGRLREAGVDAVFVVGGDAPTPAGPFADALGVLETLTAWGRPFATVGIAGYPEGHAAIDDAALAGALAAKAPHATSVLTQMCFDAAATRRWARAVHDAGVTVPIRVGVPGVVSRQKLVRISARLGLGQSARFLAKQQNLLWRFFLPGGYRPDRLVTRLAPALGAPGSALAGFHVFTFNELATTEAWRRAWLDRLAGPS